MNTSEQTDLDGLQEGRFLERRDELSAYIRAHVRNWADAEDIFQQTAIVALRKLREGLEVENMGAWSREIARRTILDHWKKNQKHALALTSDAMDAIEKTFAGHEEVRLEARLEGLTNCLSKLSPMLRKIVDRFYKDHVSLTVLGRELGRSAGAVQVSLSRTRRTLLDCVKQWESEGDLKS